MLCCVYEPLETTTTRGLASVTGLAGFLGPYSLTVMYIVHTSAHRHGIAAIILGCLLSVSYSSSPRLSCMILGCSTHSVITDCSHYLLFSSWVFPKRRPLRPDRPRDTASRTRAVTCRRPASARASRLPASPQTRPCVPKTRMWLAGAAGARVSYRVPSSRTDSWDRSAMPTRMRWTVPSMSSQPGPLAMSSRQVHGIDLHPSAYDLPPSVC